VGKSKRIVEEAISKLSIGYKELESVVGIKQAKESKTIIKNN